MSRGPKGEKCPRRRLNKTRSAVPRQDAPTQLALDYSLEEDAALLPRSATAQ